MSLINISFVFVILLNILLAFAVVFLERRNATTTWAWLMILTFLPVIGFILYSVLGQNLRRRKVFKWDQSVHTFIQKEADQQIHKIKSQNMILSPLIGPNHKKLAYMHLNNSQSVFTEGNQVEVFADGRSKFDTLIQDMESAKKHIHLLYYIIRSDQLGHKIADVLARKAQEGVQVRVLYDANGSRKLSARFIEKIKQAGGEIVAFFPIKIPFLTFRLNFRNHRKIAVIDGQVGYLGGFNIGDEYLGLHPRLGYWRDTHLRIYGKSVNNLQARFILDWNQATNQELSLMEFFDHNPYNEGNAGIQIVSSGPDSRWEHIKFGFIEMIQSAEKSVYIQTPYFIPDDSLLDVLKIAASSGIDVRIMVPGIPDHPFVYWASNSYFGELLQVGVKIYRYQAGFLHAKTVVVDNKVATVGTANMDMRSFRLNFEVNAFIYSEKLASQLTNYFLKDIQESLEYTLELYRQRPLKIRIKESLYRLLSPIL